MEKDLQPPYDVVIASHFAGPTSWDRQWQELWPRLHGRAYQTGPKCDVLYNVLYQMGIYPHIRTFRLEHSSHYQSLEEAVQALAPQAHAEAEEQKGILREYLKGAMQEENGVFVLPGSSIRVKMWWEKYLGYL